MHGREQGRDTAKIFKSNSIYCTSGLVVRTWQEENEASVMCGLVKSVIGCKGVGRSAVKSKEWRGLKRGEK